MATKSKRKTPGRPSISRHRIPLEIAGIQALLGTPGPERALNERIAATESAFHATQPELSAKAASLRSTWAREGKVVARDFVERVSGWNRNWTTLPDFHYPRRELLHVYGADVTGTGGDDFYAVQWASIDPFAGTGSFAKADRRTGNIGAGHYSTSGWMRSFGGVGVRIVPKTGVGVLSVRPYVNWSGNDLLQHRVFDPRLGEQRWGVAVGKIGIIVQSAPLAGGAFTADAIQWQDAWRRSEQNPQSAASYDGTLSSASGLTLDVPVVSSRRYVVWVVCSAMVFADSGFAVATRSTAAIQCSVPFIVVEEIPA